MANAVFAATGKRIRKLPLERQLPRLEGNTMRALVPLAVVLPIAACSRSEAAPLPDPALFEPIASVVMHPRCINCHQDKSPRQTDARTVHQPLVVRGKDGHGAPTQPCQTCHQATNTADGFVPEVATWYLAPLSMLWEGRAKEQICEQMKDPARNGGRRTGQAVIEHMKSDPLVLWAWTPGANRTTPPLSHKKFVEALEAWVNQACPARSMSELHQQRGQSDECERGEVRYTPLRRG